MHFLLLLLFPLAATAMDMPCVNCSTIPAAAVGHADVRLRKTWQAPKPAGDGVAAVRTSCSPSHFNYDDAILFPGKPAAAHLHQYFGNTAADARLTPENILSTGNSTCRGGIANRSAYWVPALIDKSNGRVIPATSLQVYYKTGYSVGRPGNRRNEDIIAPPAGLRIITGDGARKPGDPSRSRTDPKRPAYSIRCGTYQGGEFVDCPGTLVTVLIDFPQCWDGKNLWLDGSNHMRHADRNLVSANGNGCPTSHPLPIPQITYTLAYRIPEGAFASNFRWSSDHYDASLPGGLSAHADWMNGWMEGLAEQFTTEIINKGLDGGSHHAGAGQEWH